MSEAVIDLRYLRTPTTRKTKKGVTLLRTLDKEELFLPSAALAEKRLRGEMVLIAREELERAMALREGLGLPISHVYWHGSNTKAIVEELRSASTGDDAKRVLENAYDVFRFSSAHVHPNPMGGDYLRPGPKGHWPPAIVDECVYTPTIAMATLMGTDLIRTWASAIEADVDEEAAAIISDLPLGPSTPE